MAMSVTTQCPQTLNAYRAHLAEGGLAQPDVIISFTGLENKAEGITDLKDFEPVQASISMDHHVVLSQNAFSDISHPENRPTGIEWRWDSTKAKKEPALSDEMRSKAFKFDSIGNLSNSAYIPFDDFVFRLVLKAPDSEAKVLGTRLQDLTDHVARHFDNELENALAYVRFVPMGQKMVVYNIQTPLFSIGLPSRLRTRYNYWQRQMMLALEDYAFLMGFGSVNITTACYHLGRWNIEGGAGIHPRTAFQIYSLEPWKMGYKLVEMDKIDLHFRKVSLFWEKSRQDFFHVPDQPSKQE